MNNGSNAIKISEDYIAQPRAVYSHLLYLPDKSQELQKLGECISLPKNHILLEAYEESKYCYVVKSGRVISYEIYPNGEERIYHFHEEGALFLEENILFHQTSPLAFRTACATELIRIEREQFLFEIRRNPDLALDMIEAASAKFHSAMEQARHAKNYSILWKICDLLLSFADYNGKTYGNRVLIKEKISQQTISDLLGANRITTVRAIKELKTLGLIETVKGMYCMPDVEALREYRDDSDKNWK